MSNFSQKLIGWLKDTNEPSGSILARTKNTKNIKNTKTPTKPETTTKIEQTPPEPIIKTAADLAKILKNTPEHILTKQEKRAISSVLNLPYRKIKNILPKPQDTITVLHKNDFLGPILLDKLHKTGSHIFPVVSGQNQVIGSVNIDKLLSLDIKETDRVVKYLDENTMFISEDYTLEQALAALLRQSSFHAIVVNKQSQPTGIITIQDLLQDILGKPIEDSFDQDYQIQKVTSRQ